MPVAAPITRDLTIDGVGLGAVGVLGLVAGIAATGGDVARMIVPWIIVVVVLGLAQVVVSGGWLRTAVADAPAPPPGLEIEDRGAQLRRAGLPTVVALALVLAAVFAIPAMASVVAGLAAGAAATDLRTRKWIQELERENGEVILREVTALPFATTRKPLWAAPAPPA